MTQGDGQQEPSYNVVVRMSGPACPLEDAERLLAMKMSPGIPAPELISVLATIDNSLRAERTMAMLPSFCDLRMILLRSAP